MSPNVLCFCRLGWLLGFVTITELSCTSDNSNSQDASTQDTSGQDSTNPQENTLPKNLVWSSRMEIDLDRAGLQLSLSVAPDGNFAVAYYQENTQLGTCETPILGGPATPVLKDNVRFAKFDGTTWVVQDIETIESTMLTGIGLVYDGQAPLVAYLGGVEGEQVCGGSDLMVARGSGSGWNILAAVMRSNEALAGDDCPKMQNICDQFGRPGDVVGLWPSIARAPNGTIGISYRDIHNGYTKEATDSSDLEYTAWTGSAWTHEWIDLAHGAGDFSSLAFGSDNQPSVAYYNGKYGYIGFAKRPFRDWTLPPNCSQNACPGDLTCHPDEQHCICETNDQCAPDLCIGERCSPVVHKMERGLGDRHLSHAVHPEDGRYLVAFFNVDRQSLWLAHSKDGHLWEKGTIDADGSTGMYPSLVLDPVTQRPGIAYYRCGRAQDGLVCNRNHDGLRYAYFTGNYPEELTDPTKWKKSIVSEDSVAFDGAQTSAAIAPDGTVGIAFHYGWLDQNTPKTHLMFKRGTWE